MENVDSMMEKDIDRHSKYLVKFVIAIVLIYISVYMWILLNTSMAILAIPIIILLAGVLALVAGFYKVSIQFHINIDDVNLDTSQDSSGEDDNKYRFIPVKPQGPNPYKVNATIANVLEPLEPVTPPLETLPQTHED